ncbi:MAG TPA: flagellar protein FlgN [Hydrogenispora sp.]|nr:flagellar protein FlgN [Hydrogenispora sp.]
MSTEVENRMAEELNLLQQLVDLAVAKKEALFKNDLEALRKIVDDEEQTLAKAESLPPQNNGEISVSAEGQRLRQERAALIDRLKELNLLNQQLLEDALAIVDYSLKLIHGDEEGNMYGSSGQVETVGKSSVLNWRG